MIITETAKKELKKPLGKVYSDYREITKLSKKYRIISVGDVCTLALLDLGICPHLAVFDLKFMRKKLRPAHALILKRVFGKAIKMKNKAGTISEEILENAKDILERGGGLLIDGEEDLTALAFIKAATSKYILVYGQPGEGMVIVKNDDKTKKKVDRILAT